MLECKQELQLAAQIYIYFVNNSVEPTDSCSGWIQKAMSPQSDAPSLYVRAPCLNVLSPSPK